MATQDNGNNDILLNVNVTGTEDIRAATQEVNKLGGSVDKINDKPVNGDGFKNYKTQIREARSELEKIEQQSGKNSAAFQRQAQVLAQLKDRQQELNDTVKAFDVDNKLAAFGKTASAATGVLAGFSGGLVALGFNSEKSAENLARLQGLLAFSHSLSQLDDLKNSFKDIGLVIQAALLPKQADTAATEAQIAANEANVIAQEAVVTATNERIAAETALATATETTSSLQIEAETALAEARAAGLDAEIELTGAEEAYLELASATAAAKLEQTAAQEAYNLALAQEAELTGAAVATQEALTVATAAETVSTGAATIAATAFGIALKALGIGLIISAIVALITQFDNIKASLSKLFPAVKDSTSVFHDFMEVINGVGLVVLKFLKAPIDQAVTSFKVLVDVIKGDFKAAAADLKEGIKNIADDLDVINNYKKGAADKAADYADEKRKEETQKTIEQNERQLKLLKAAGKDTTDLAIATEKLKLSVLDKSSKDYAEKFADGNNEILVLQAEHNKKLQDAKDKAAKEAAEKAKAALKTDLDAIKKANDDNLKVINEGNSDARNKELADIDTKYKAEFALLEKRKKDNINYNKDFNDAVTARKLEEARINRKYDDQIADYLKGIQNENLDTYDKAINEINKKIDDQLKNATPEQADLLEAARNEQINKQRGLNIANSNAANANANDVRVNSKNKSKVGDTADISKDKVNNNEQADIEKEKAEFDAKILTLQGQDDQIELLTQQHEAKLTDIKEEAAQKRKDIDQTAFEAKKSVTQAEIELVGQFGEFLGVIAGKNKALEIASIGLETASAVGKIVVNTQLANAKAVAASPLTGGLPWVAINTASGILAGSTAVAAAVKSIQQINSGTADGGISTAPSSVGGGATSAPIINSTVLQQANSGTQDIVNAVKTDKSTPVKAYVVLKDLQTAQAKDNLNNKLSSY